MGMEGRWGPVFPGAEGFSCLGLLQTAASGGAPWPHAVLAQMEAWWGQLGLC